MGWNVEQQVYDDAFYTEKSKWGTWKSFSKEGKSLITSLTEEQCISATRFYLKGLQEGFDEVKTTKYDGTVGGKL
jgi:hypothetical protein